MTGDRSNVDNALSVVGDGWEEGIGVVELLHVNVTRINVDEVLTENRGSTLKKAKNGNSLKEGMERVIAEEHMSISKMEGDVEKSRSMLFTEREMVVLFWEMERSDCRLEMEMGTNVIGTGTKMELGRSIRMLVQEIVVKVVSYD